MRKTTAAQQRLFDNAVLIAATRLLFDAMREHFPCPRLDEIVTIHNGQGLPATDRDAAGEYDVYAAGGLVGRHSARLSDKPFVVVGRKGSAGKPTYAPLGGWVIDTAYYVQPNDDTRLDCKFLFYALSSLDFTNNIISTAIPGINRTSIYRYAIPLPPRNVQEACVRFLDAAATRPLGEIPSLPPLFSEQQRIVARIEALAAKIEEARGLRRQAVKEAEALIATTLSGLFSTGRENGWTTGRPGDYVVDDCYGTSEKTSDDESGTSILRMGNIQSGRLDLHDLKYLHLNDKDRARLLLERGDILVNRTNSAELVGKCAVFDLEEEYAFASYLIRLRLDTTRAEPRLVASYINSPAGRAYMFSERKQMTGQANVNATKLKALPIALPALSEQRRIVAYLDNLWAKVDALKRLQAETAAELDALLPSVLDKAFKGEL